MDVHVQYADGQRLPLSGGVVVAIGTATDCALRPDLPGLPPKLAAITPGRGEAWLQVQVQVQQPEALVCVNARPVRELARLQPGDRVCIDTWCMELVGRLPDAWPDTAIDDDIDGAGVVPDNSVAGHPPADVFALRCLNGRDHGRLHAGPVVHLDASGDIATGAGADELVELGLSGRQLCLDPGSLAVSVNGHPIRGRVRPGNGDQLRVGARRYRIESWLQGPDPAPPVPDPADAATPAPPALAGQGAAVRPGGSLLWLVVVAALLAAALTGLLTWHSGW